MANKEELTKNRKEPCTNKDLLQLEHRDTSAANGAKLLSLCNTQKAAVVSSLKTAPLNESSVLSRVKAFLPVLNDANHKLDQAIKEKGAYEFDIEVLNGNEETSYVEMDLALGVADLRSSDAVSVAERLVGGEVLDLSCRSEEDSDSEGGSLHNQDGEEEIDMVVGKKKKRPRIEQLS